MTDYSSLKQNKEVNVTGMICLNKIKCGLKKFTSKVRNEWINYFKENNMWPCIFKADWDILVTNMELDCWEDPFIEFLTIF